MTWPAQQQLALRQALAELIQASPEGSSEYELIKRLQEPPYCLLDGAQLKQELALFQCHFFVFNALYQLQLEWLEQKKGLLTIEALKIQLLPYEPGQAGLTQVDPLREYYLDWTNYESTGEQEVEQLLTSFWRRMAGEKTRQEASQEELLNALELLQMPQSHPIELPLLKKQYRRLQHQHHPDKGGLVENSKQLERAYRLLLAQCS